MRSGITRRSAAIGVAAELGCGAMAAPAPPRRVVSLNPCLDAILVRVADRSQVAALSHYSHDPSSSSSGALGLTFPITHGGVEEVAALRPDLVLMTPFTPPSARTAFDRLGVRRREFGQPETVAASLTQVAEVAAAVGRAARGAALVARIEAALEAARPPAGARRLSALVFQAGGFVVAEGTMMDEMLRRTGFINAASQYGMKRSGAVSLERLVADPPQVLLAAQVEPGAPTWADRVLEHPALARVAPRMRRAAFPQQLTFCGGPVLIETARMLARARTEALADGA